ncbi:hypothetical protein DFH09DRAFT_914881, partial [Mycena vulgaris]
QLFEAAQGLAYLHSTTVVHGDLRGVREFMRELCGPPAEDVEESAAGIHRQFCSHQVRKMCQNLTLNLDKGFSAETGSSSSYTSTSSSF